MFSLESLFSLRGRTALVTGGSTGLGRICAEALLVAGARVLIASRKHDNCVAVARELSALGPCEGFAGDVHSEDGVRVFAEAVRQRTDTLDIVINNAGATWGADFETFPWSGWDRVLSVNLTGLFTLTRELMPMLLAAGSPQSPARVVNIGSVTGTLPIAERAYSYAASKAAVHHLTRMLSHEFAARHVNINAIAPGPFATRMTAFALNSEEGRAHASAAVPMRRLGQPSDLAGTVLFLCGPGSAYTTGAIIPVDGGMSADVPQQLWPDSV